MKKLTKTITALLAAMLLVAAALPTAFAAPFKYTAVNGTTTTFYKYLVMENDANVPTASFDFTIAPATAIPAVTTGDETTMAVLAGIPGATITATVNFTPSDTTQAGRPGDTTPTEGYKYASKKVTVNFSGVSFPEPGVYRYTVTESGSNRGVTNDTQLTRTLDVYVTDNGSKELVVSSYVLHTDTDAPAAGANWGSADVDNADDPLDDKSDGFTNEYDTSNLTFSKEVSGNQASRDKYFKFTVTIEDAVKETKYDVDLTNADKSISANPNPATTCISAAVTQPTTLMTDNGTVTATFYLQHGQSITIKGIVEGTKYTVTEEYEDYKPSAANGTISGTIASDDVTAAFTNTRDGVIPTGVLLTVAPFAAIMVIGAAGIVVMVSKKRKRAE